MVETCALEPRPFSTSIDVETSYAVGTDVDAVAIGMYDDSAAAVEGLGGPKRGDGDGTDSCGYLGFAWFELKATRWLGAVDGMVGRKGGGRGCNGGPVCS